MSGCKRGSPGIEPGCRSDVGSISRDGGGAVQVRRDCHVRPGLVSARRRDRLDLLDRWLSQQAGGMIIVAGPVLSSAVGPQLERIRERGKIAGFFPDQSVDTRAGLLGGGRKEDDALANRVHARGTPRRVPVGLPKTRQRASRFGRTLAASTITSAPRAPSRAQRSTAIFRIPPLRSVDRCRSISRRSFTVPDAFTFKAVVRSGDCAARAIRISTATTPNWCVGSAEVGCCGTATAASCWSIQPRRWSVTRSPFAPC